MNTPLPVHDDDDLEALLSEDSELLKRYRALPLNEPGKHLDTAILGRAGNAVRRPTVRQRWLIPIASAASVVAAAGIGWRVHVAQQQEQAAAASAESGHYEVMEIDLQSGDRRRALDTAVMPPQAPREQGALGAAAPAAKDKERATLSEIISGPARDNGVFVVPKPAVEPHTSTDHADQGRVPEQRQFQTQPFGDALDASRAPSSSAPAPAGEAEKLDRVEVTGAGIKRSEMEDQREDDAAGSDTLGGSMRKSVAEPMLAPADWIERIRALISARRLPQASDEIRRFRSAYPNYRLPPDLRRYER